MSWIILTPDPIPLPITAEHLRGGADQAWPGRWKEMGVDRFTVFSVGLELPGETSYTVDLFPEGKGVGTDGTWPQALRTAAWVRSLLPADFAGRVWLIDLSFYGHAELPAGVTAEQIKAGWLDHEVHGYPEDAS